MAGEFLPRPLIGDPFSAVSSIVVETDPAVVCHRVSLRLDESSFSEQSVKQVLQSAKENLKWSLLK